MEQRLRKKALKNKIAFWSEADSYASLAGRVLIAFLFLLSGASKAANPSAAIDHIASIGLPAPNAWLACAIAAEVGGGIALIIGYRPRVVAVGLAGFAILAAVFFHSQLADQNQLTHFLKNMAIAGGLLQVAAFGAGRCSITPVAPPPNSAPRSSASGERLTASPPHSVSGTIASA